MIASLSASLALPVIAVWSPAMHDDFSGPLDTTVWAFHPHSSHAYPSELQRYSTRDAYTEDGKLVMRTRPVMTQTCISCSECGWPNEQDSPGSLDGGGHTQKECLSACIGSPSCNFAARSIKGYCHLFQTCAHGASTGEWTRWTKRVPNATYEYTSGAVDSGAGFVHTFGRWQGFAQLPPDSDHQVWPAIWMTPVAGSAPADRSCWPMSGEFDIMEFWAGRHTMPEACAAYHNGNSCGNDTLGSSLGCSKSATLTAYHLYALEWTHDKVEFFFDDVSLGVISGADKEIPTWPMGWRINQAVCGAKYCQTSEGPVQHDSYFRLDFVSVLDYKKTDFCDDGLQAGRACCPKQCGLCGGVGCNLRPGGSDRCCTGMILEKGKACTSASETACVMPTEEAAIWRTV